VVLSAEVVKKAVKNLIFFAPQIWGGAHNFWAAFVNQHLFRPTGQVWLRSHGWSFIYADERKYSGKI